MVAFSAVSAVRECAQLETGDWRSVEQTKEEVASSYLLDRGEKVSTIVFSAIKP